ncbi:response regulator [Filimonas effusa]|uniref:Response regulator n=1 Tax=Filimonas effusa TaxID=2508721 RepID=A0A4Q1DD24_9BACT|nr:response regulator [Filimonas effusa]
MLCLIVDDDADDQELFSAAMEKTMLDNYTCIFAGDGAEAIALLNTAPVPDYIFLDLNMPRLNGLQCLSEIRKQERLQEVPVAIYSTSSDELSKNKALGLGATAFISKPTRFHELISKLNDFFSAHAPAKKH